MNLKNVFLIFISTFFISVCYSQKQTPVVVNVDITKTKGELKPVWAMFGYDEPNYTYTKNGKKLLTEIAELSPVPVYVRVHHLMTSDDGAHALKWGSTNMYTEDSLGKPIYSWTVVDKIFDTFIELKMRPIAQIGFMPLALSTKPLPYKSSFADATNPAVKGGGYKYPPKDYDKWSELIYQWVTHCIERYGKAEVETWYWELWNEPDSPNYLQSDDNLKTYCKMYDYASLAIKRALPTARIGAPHVTGGGKDFMIGFLNHVFHEPNSVNGQKGIVPDYLSFHSKGAPTKVGDMVQMGLSAHFKGMSRNFEAIASIPEAKNIPIIIGECDPDACAACRVDRKPANTYRNGTLFSSYIAACYGRIYDIAESYHVNLVGAVNWSFEFENQPWFDTYRDLATNGVDKPVLNTFRMLGMMTGNRVEVSGNFAYDYKTIRESGVQGVLTDINALAAADKNKVTVMVWNYHDNDIKDDGSPIEVKIKGIPTKKAKLIQYLIDQENSNSYEVWKKMGSPQSPTTEQYAILEKAGKLAQIVSKDIVIENGNAYINVLLSRQAVLLIKIEY